MFPNLKYHSEHISITVQPSVFANVRFNLLSPWHLQKLGARRKRHLASVCALGSLYLPKNLEMLLRYLLLSTSPVRRQLCSGKLKVGHFQIRVMSKFITVQGHRVML